MEPQHRRVLNRRRVALLEGLQLEPVLDAMQASKLFSVADVKQVNLHAQLHAPMSMPILNVHVQNSANNIHHIYRAR